MNALELLVTGIFLVAFVDGVRSTWHLWREYRATSPTLTEPRAYLVLWAVVVVCVVITVACGYFGFLSLRRLVGFEPIPGISVVSTVIIAGVVMIPRFLKLIVARISAS